MAFDPVQRLLAIGTKSGSLRMYPLLRREATDCARTAFRGSTPFDPTYTYVCAYRRRTISRDDAGIPSLFLSVYLYEVY